MSNKNPQSPVEIGKEIKITISIIGESKTGKTSLWNTWINPDFITNDHNQTLGIDLRYYKNNSIHIKFFDFGSFELKANHKALEQIAWHSNYVIFVIDSNSPYSLNYFGQYLSFFANSKIIALFNKDDLPMTVTESSEGFRQIKSKNNIVKIMKCSAIDKEKVEKFRSELIGFIKDEYSKTKHEAGWDGKNFEFYPNLVYYKKEVNKKARSCFG